ncbi:hypothetical protein KXX16_001233 [Aspergillus fumigatus]|uniref:Uncharacterized protein n=1 Tax=Aspergillus fumigatus TaxID=746128 RepID=A0A229XTI2_ASPFM|nr:hypothetical protein CNMCM8057_002437 [Aspergillus fumigatus]KAF4283796.1 hypothetical protein CNMCM8689_006788 [Aspergillus fumigatus]KAF4289335.1 hypothetical protein CNMCM8686_002835 [Aspergillus fumigatus]KAH1269474.1 hypothetical protein KXX45_002892 [Aspergillus fumigatus]KAH1292149.1 hypothetical protein KXX48_006610 [Aspergillus fumigatus]
MATKQRLTLASMWAFEAIGVKEIEVEIKNTIPQLDSLEYFQTDDVLVTKGNVESFVVKVASAFSGFIEEQKDKDLLDTPRVRQLDVPAVLSDEGLPAMSSPEKHQGPNLLALEDDSDEDIVPYSRNHATKFWKSPNGGLGCFSSNFRDVLTGVAIATGTEIAILDESQGIRVFGTTEDVDDALMKLTQIEKPLSFSLAPNVTNIMITPHKDDSRFRIQNYSSVNPDALRRVREDPKMCSAIDFGRMCVTVGLSFNKESQVWTIPDNRLNPLPISEEAGPSRIWNDFTFQEIGKADEFVDIEAIIENDPSKPQTLISGIAPPHPFLTADKVKQVNQWVVERAEMQPTEHEPEPEPEPELESDFEPQPEYEGRDIHQLKLKRETAIIPQSKRPPGMKTRKAAITAKVAPPSEQSLATETKPVAIGLKETTANPRKRWTMLYSSGAEDASPDDSDALNSGISNLNDTLELPGDFLEFAKPQTSENKVRLPGNFDAGKYGLNQSSRQTSKEGKHSPSFKKIVQVKSKKNSSDPNELIDVFEPGNNTVVGTLSRIPFNQPPLIPDSLVNESTSNTRKMCLQETSDSNSKNTKNGLLSCGMGDHSTPSGSGSTESMFGRAAAGDENHQEQENRLSFLKNFLQERTDNISYHGGYGQTHTSRYEFNKLLVKESLAKLETVHRDQDRQGSDETSTREFYRTMGHKTAKPTNKAKSKSEIKSKRQATLEDAWGFFKKPVKKPSAVAQTLKTTRQSIQESERETVHMASRKNELAAEPAENSMARDVENLFEALKQTLEAAEYFQGSLNLEVHLGLILIPLLPKTCSEGSTIYLTEWTKIFQSQTGIPSPTTRFISRLTTSGIDIDYLVDLKTATPEGKRRIFEQDFREYSVFYEFHCHTRTGQVLVLSVDEQGKFNIKNPNFGLGAVNLHFPHQVWDASIVLSGTPNDAAVDQEFEEAAKYIIEHLWVRPDTSLVQIFTRLPPGDKITIEKVYMKRWTRHRFIHPPKSIIAANGASHIRSNSARIVETDLNSNSADRRQTSAENEAETMENQDIFLQVMEVQDLCIGSSPSDVRAVTACCVSLPEMMGSGRQWYEASLVSSAIEAILRTNANLEIGERTDEWRSSDLLGRDAVLLDGNAAKPDGPNTPLSPVAKAIGIAGLGDLLRLTKTVVEEMDGVGFWGHGLDHDSVQAPSITGSVGTLDQMVRLEPRSLDFDDFESIKKFGSVMATTLTKKSSGGSSAKDKEQLEIDYW